MSATEKSGQVYSMFITHNDRPFFDSLSSANISFMMDNCTLSALEKSGKCKIWMSHVIFLCCILNNKLYFFCIQFEVTRLKSRQLFHQKSPWKALKLYIYFGYFVKIWNFKWL